MSEVAIAIPTFKRPNGLSRLLSALCELQTKHTIRVIVGDNDPSQHQGYDYCVGISGDYRWPIDSFIVEERGISAARNALISHALRDPETRIIAMLDDDQWPTTHWLDELVRIQQATHADVVGGAVEFVFDKPVPDWVRRCGAFTCQAAPTGVIDRVFSTNNILFTRACLEGVRRPWFDMEFGLSGGEDTDFLVRLKQRNQRFAWSNEALAYESVPSSRTTLHWILSRSYRTGISTTRVVVKHYGAFTPGNAKVWAAEVVKALVGILLLPIAVVAFVWSPSRAVAMMRGFSRAIGKVAALFGLRHYEYLSPHGN